MAPQIVPKLRNGLKLLPPTAETVKRRHMDQPTDTRSNRCLLIAIVETKADSRRNPRRRHKQHAKAPNKVAGCEAFGYRSKTFKIILRGQEREDSPEGKGRESSRDRSHTALKLQ